VLNCSFVLASCDHFETHSQASYFVSHVQIETGEPLPDAPEEGRLEVSVECSNSLFSVFDDRGGSDINATLSKMLGRAIQEVQNANIL
jgi:exosome complex RNA-binding protein Rrp42 (RNase PH superfamily)